MRRGETKRLIRVGAAGTQVEQYRDTQATTTMASSVAEEARDFSIAGTGRACSDRRSRKDEYSNGALQSEDRVCFLQPIHHGCEQE